ncbi:restriction endonuclease subunit S [Shewanella baltica]|uniref:restriction endonuclease subunit S n=1 Tax=Shewanella baltica TaxID=62322 RepID=UPI00217D286B|nr:restriction endonuclease subunit S [Shewanella baltica]MCS6175770.1 restriction endonuclease subunit S [Shewanella baltica]
MSELKASKYQAYPEYKDSGVEWVGDIPADWSISKLKYVASIHGRIGFRGYTVDDIVDEGEGAIVLSPSNIDCDTFDINKKVYLSWFKYYESPEIMVNAGDVLLVKTGSTYGKSAIIRSVDEPMTINPQMAILKNSKMDSRYLAYLMNSSLIRAKIDISNTGSGMPTMTQETINSFPIPHPKNNLDMKIANFLDYETAKIDTLIDKQQQLIKLLKEKRQAVISHAVTKGIPNKEHQNVPMKDSGVEWLGEVPAHWELVPLKYLCQFSGGGTPSKDNLVYWTNGSIPWVSPKDMKTFWLDKTQDYITDIAVKESSTNLVESGALLMVVRSGILQRSIPIAINQVPVTLNQDMKALRFNKRMLATYAADYILGNVEQLLLEWSKEGATVESIEHEYLANSVLPVPPIDVLV